MIQKKVWVQILFHGGVFFLLLETFLEYRGIAGYLLGGLLLNVLLAWKILYGGFFRFFVPTVLSFSSLVLLHAVDISLQKQIFVGVSTLLFVAFLVAQRKLHVHKHNPLALGIVSAVVTSTLFIFFAACNSWSINYSIPFWIYVSLHMIVVSGVTYASLFLLKNNDTYMDIRYALMLGLFAGELSWVSTFWPFGYLTTGVIMLVFYYVLWDIAQNYVQNSLTRSKIISDILIIVVFSTLVLVTTKWIL